MSIASEAPLPADFRPTKLILLSELPAREKEKYFQLLLLNNVKFIRQGDGPECRYIGNFRMLAPFVRKPEDDKKKKDTSNYALTFQERLMKLRTEGFVQVRIAGVEPFDYTVYPRFSSLIANRGDTVKPKLRPLSWLMKHVEDIYDARFEHEKNEVEREDESPAFDLILLIFPIFVVRKVGTNVGLKSLLDQTCWDILYSVNTYRRDYLELEIFARFLQEFYDHDDLLFYLYVRSVISKVLHVNFKNRWVKFDGPGRQPRSQWMSFREAAHIARIVFGSDSDDMYRDFILLITPQMIGSKTDATDTRRIDITEYLHLSVVGYHQSSKRNNDNGEGGMLLPLPGQVVPSAPVPALPETAPQPVAERYNEAAEREQVLLEEEEARGARAGYGAYGGYTGNGNGGNVGNAGNSGGRGAARASSEHNKPASYAPPVSYSASNEGAFADNNQHRAAAAGALDGSAGRGYGYTQEAGLGAAAALSPDVPGAFGGVRDEEQDFAQLLPGSQSASRGLDAENDVYPQGNALGNVAVDPAPVQPETDDVPADKAEVPQQEQLNPFEQLQLDREEEFMAQVMVPLLDAPPEVYAYVDADLKDRLHQTVSMLLSDREEIEDIEGLDAALVEILSLDQLKEDMEGLRDEIVLSLMPNQEATL